MIPRLHHRRLRRETHFAFGRGALARPLRIYIDSENTPPGEALDVLVSFAAHDHVEVLFTDCSAPDRVIVGPLDAQGGYRPFNVERADGSRSNSIVRGNIPD